jgi:hypothetical protein
VAHETKPASPPPLPDHREAVESLRRIEGLADLPTVPMSHRELRGTLEAVLAEARAALRLLDAPAPVAAPEHDAHEGCGAESCDGTCAGPDAFDRCTKCKRGTCAIIWDTATDERLCVPCARAASPADGATKGGAK